MNEHTYELPSNPLSKEYLRATALAKILVDDKQMKIRQTWDSKISRLIFDVKSELAIFLLKL